MTTNHCRGIFGWESEKTADAREREGLTKGRKKGRDSKKLRLWGTKLSEADDWGRGEGAQCAESLLFSLTFRRMCWLVESTSFRWRFLVPRVWLGTKTCSFPVTTVTLTFSKAAVCHQSLALVWYCMDQPGDRCVEVGGLWSAGACECGISGCEVQVQAVYILSSCPAACQAGLHARSIMNY